ncbi:MAG: S41 family peptidase [Pseudomonadota bacterium]
MRVVSRFILVAAVASLVACAGGSSSPSRPKQLGFKETFPLDPEREPSLDGVWSNDKFGLMLEFEGEKLTIYNRVSRYCWPEEVAALNADYRAGLTEFNLMSDKSSVKFRRDRRAGEWPFQPAAGLPTSCEKPLDRLGTFDVFGDLMRQHYPHFERRQVLWTRTVADLRREVTKVANDDELLALITEATSKIGDPNLRITGPGFTWVGEDSGSRQTDMLKVAFNRQDVIEVFSDYEKRWYGAIQQQIPSRLLGGEFESRFDGNLVYGRMAGNLGYLYIAQTGSASAADWKDALEVALESLASSQSLIIDVSMSAGGSPDVMTHLVDLLMPRKTPMYLRKFNRVFDDWVVTESTRKPLYGQKPIYVVTTNHTSGAAELVPLVLRQMGNVRLIGETTRGALNQTWLKSLPNGWVLHLPLVIVADRQENDFDGVGLQPDFALELFSESQLTDAHWQALQTLAALIGEGHFETYGP